MILSTTFAKLKEFGACESGYKKLATHLGGITKYGRDKPINLLTILDSNGVKDCVWALRAAVEPDRDKIARLFACDCAESVLPIFESEKPDDPRPRKAIQTARDYAVGLATQEQLAAAWAAAQDAARAAAWAAAQDAARDAAGAAARAAAGAAAGAAQSENLRKYLTGEKP
jgi:hypothetical protein